MDPRQPSPFPEVDHFMEQVIKKWPGQTVGYIRSWVYFPESQSISYNVAANRFCQMIGREHKGNHIMLVADLTNRTYYQKCHDLDCRGRKSTPVRLPAYLFGEEEPVVESPASESPPKPKLNVLFVYKKQQTEKNNEESVGDQSNLS